MVNFDTDSDDDKQMRERVARILVDVFDHDRGWPEPTVRIFSVDRTNDRKGYRDVRLFNNSSPYQEDPKVLVKIEVEFDDTITNDAEMLVESVSVIEKRRRIAAAEAELESAANTEETAKQRRERAEEALRKLRE